jgi:hypothetical protein
MLYFELIKLIRRKFMSETETLQTGQTDTVTGAGSVTTDDGMQQTVTGDAVAPVVDPSVTPVDPVVPPVDSTPVVDSTVPSVDPVVDATASVPVVAVDSTPAPVVIMYNGQVVKFRQGTFDADGAELCELADGSTAYVPKSVLGV